MSSVLLYHQNLLSRTFIEILNLFYENLWRQTSSKFKVIWINYFSSSFSAFRIGVFINAESYQTESMIKHQRDTIAIFLLFLGAKRHFLDSMQLEVIASHLEVTNWGFNSRLTMRCWCWGSLAVVPKIRQKKIVHQDFSLGGIKLPRTLTQETTACKCFKVHSRKNGVNF